MLLDVLAGAVPSLVPVSVLAAPCPGTPPPLGPLPPSREQTS
jgi:hypothetical protein